MKKEPRPATNGLRIVHRSRNKEDDQLRLLQVTSGFNEDVNNLKEIIKTTFSPYRWLLVRMFRTDGSLIQERLREVLSMDELLLGANSILFVLQSELMHTAIITPASPPLRLIVLSA